MSRDDLVMLDSTYDAVYSPDDGGWYPQKYPGGKTSKKIYSDKDKAVEAYRNHIRSIEKIQWNK